MGLTDVQTRSVSRSVSGRGRPIAVIDIGSNSVRLVVYQYLLRSPAVLHNEKAICAIGRNMVSTGQLDERGIALALDALVRFRALCEGHDVASCDAVATAAARDAANGREFIRRAEKALGCAIQVLSGENEAKLAAEGVLAGIPRAEGLAADLGGGSLDMALVTGGRTGDAATLPFGPLRLMDLSGGETSKARALVDEALKGLDLMRGLKGRALYAVGGIWRALARVEMEMQNYPLRVLHNYVIPRSRALKLCKVVSGLGRKSLEKMESVPRRRAEALPYGALVLERLIQAADLKEVAISAYGLREGVFFRHLPPAERAKDPLIEYAADVNRRESRSPDYAAELFQWMTAVFPNETAAERRVRQAACLFADVGWRRHPDDRAIGAFAQVLRAPYTGADHRERAIIATALYYRYSGEDDFPDETGVAGLVGAEGAVLALRIGLAARLSFTLTSAIPGGLLSMPLRLTGQTLALEIPSRRKTLLGDAVSKRLDDLAEAFGRKPDTAIV